MCNGDGVSVWEEKSWRGWWSHDTVNVLRADAVHLKLMKTLRAGWRIYCYNKKL